jgi:maltose-binding protein MalE
MNKKTLAVSTFLTALLLACGPTSNGDQITLTYAAWNLQTAELNNIERQMIAVYEEENPNINIEVIERPVVVNEEGQEQDVGWEEFFATQAAVDNLPDVYMVYSLANFTTQGWAEDVTDLVQADADFNLIPEDIQRSTAFGDQYFAIPQALFYYGFFINRSAINRVGPRSVMPTYGMTFQEFMDAAEKNSKAPIQGGDAIIGVSGLDSLVNWLPAQMNPELGWFTFNEETGYHLDGPEFETAVNEQLKYFGPGNSAYSSYVLEALNPSLYPDYFGVSSNVFESGNQSMRWEGSFSMRNWFTRAANPTDSMYGMEIDFIGTPSWDADGVNVNKIPVVVDYIALGKGTEHRQEAYDFAKWMGYGADAYAKRLELAEANPLTAALNFTPIVPREDLIDGFFDLYPQMTEFKKIVSEHEDFILESVGKNVPGYWDSRQNAIFDVIQNDEGQDVNRSMGQAINDICYGRLALADALQQGLNTIANQEWQEAKAALDAYINSLD